MKKDYWAKLKPNVCYHIYNRAVGKENLFCQHGHFMYFLERWRHYISPYFSTYAFCLMPNHFHFLAKAKPITDDICLEIAQQTSQKAVAFLQGEVDANIFYTSQFKALFNSYTGGFNKERLRHGSLFQAKFKRIIIRDMGHFNRMLYYIHHNPIHHNFCKQYEDWAYTSYAFYTDMLEDWVAIKPVLKRFADENDASGVANFTTAHVNFKQNFKEDQVSDTSEVSYS